MNFPITGRVKGNNIQDVPGYCIGDRRDKLYEKIRKTSYTPMIKNSRAI